MIHFVVRAKCLNVPPHTDYHYIGGADPASSHPCTWPASQKSAYQFKKKGDADFFARTPPGLREVVLVKEGKHEAKT